MIEPNPRPDPATDQAEAYKVLVDRLGRKGGKIPAEVLVRHIMAIVPADEWPARVEGLDALVRRLESARRDGLRIESRPARDRLLGTYATSRRRSDVRPYRTVIAGVRPIEGRCDCPDYLRNSLAACKHILAVVEHLYARPRLLARAIKEQEAAADTTTTGLRWDPIRPLTGAGDWLERITWQAPAATRTAVTSRRAGALRWFRAGKDGEFRLTRTFADSPPRRLELVEDLLRLLPTAAASGFDPALRALLSNERRRLQAQLKRVTTPAERKAALKHLKRPLYPYQRAGVDRFLDDGRLVLADDMGLGKTAQAIAAADVLWRARRIRRGLIIAPASLKAQWAREWETFSDVPARVVEGSPAERHELYESTRTGLFILSYEQLIRDLEPIRRWGPDLVVLDEAQRIKNWATKTALSVKGLDPPYRLVLTGTPMENRIEELASVVEWVDDMALEPKWRLGPVHAVRADGRREITGVRHLDTLRERLRGCLLRRVRQEVLDQLPPRTDTRVPVEMTEEQQAEHDALIQPIAALVQRSKVRPLTQVEFLRLMSLLTTQRVISNGLAQYRFEEVWPAIGRLTPEESLIRGLSAPKLLEFRQLVRQLALEQGRKVVVFSQWRRMLTLARWAVGDILDEDGLRAGFFTGSEGQRRRTQNIVEFHDDPKHRLLFASDAGGVGLNLQHASNCVINLELPWNPAVLEQRIGRVYRLGQTQPIDVFNLVSEQGIEARIAGLVGSKQAFFKGLFDGDSDSVQFEQSGSFLSRVGTFYPAAPAPADGDDSGPLDIGDDGEDSFDDMLDAADEEHEPIEPEPLPIAAPAPPPPPEPVRPAGDVRQLFSRLQIRREADGRVLIEAPPDAADELGALFEGMARLIRSAGSGAGGGTTVEGGAG